MSGSCFAERLGDLVTLTPAEHAALEKLEERERPVRRGATIQRENDRGGELFVVRKGVLMTSMLLDDGSRQILRFLFPGDMIGLPALAYSEAPETVTALNDSVVAPFERVALAEILATHPRLAALLLVYSQIERAALTDRLAALGRTSAKARVAAVLIGDFGRDTETTEGIAGVLGDYVVENVPLSELKAFTPKVEGVDPAAVQRVAQRLLDPTGASIIVVGDAKLFIDELRKKYPQVEVIPADKLNLDSPTLK